MTHPEKQKTFRAGLAKSLRNLADVARNGSEGEFPDVDDVPVAGFSVFLHRAVFFLMGPQWNPKTKNPSQKFCKGLIFLVGRIGIEPITY